MGCCFSHKKIVGNVIFHPIDIKLEKCGNDDLDQYFIEANKVLDQCEETRKKIAEKFLNMIVETGVCVLKQPCFERCISSFLVQILIEINCDIAGDKEKLQNFNFSSLFQFTTSHPYISYNCEKAQELKNTLKIDITDNPNLMKAKDAIGQFIESLCSFKDIYQDLSKAANTLYHNTAEFISKVKEKMKSDGHDHITLGQAVDYIHKAETNLKNFFQIKGVISLSNNIILEKYQTMQTILNVVFHPSEMAKWQRIAEDAYNKKIFDPKQVVFYYAKEEKVKRIEDWKDNICYREEDEELNF